MEMSGWIAFPLCFAGWWIYLELTDKEFEKRIEPLSIVDSQGPVAVRFFGSAAVWLFIFWQLTGSK